MVTRTFRTVAKHLILLVSVFSFGQIASAAKGQIRCEEVIDNLFSCVAMSKMTGIDYHYTLDLSVGFCGVTITGPESDAEIEFEDVACEKLLQRKEIAEFIEMSLSQPPEPKKPTLPEAIPEPENAPNSSISDLAEEPPRS